MDLLQRPILKEDGSSTMILGTNGCYM